MPPEAWGALTISLRHLRIARNLRCHWKQNYKTQQRIQKHLRKAKKMERRTLTLLNVK